MAYFQAFTNTYGPVERLRRIYYEAIAPEDIVGLAIGTRPDCLGEDVVALLAEINRIKPVCVELGLQSIHPETARYIRRGYEAEVYFDAVRRLKAAGIEVVTHIILGLPGETEENPRGKASRESHRSLDPREGKRDTAATAREESARACPHSRRGLTPLGRLQKYPKIHVSTGEESSGSGTDSTQGFRPQHRRERKPKRPPRGPRATRKGTGLS